MRVLVIQGPNLNLLGERDPSIYGALSLEALHDHLRKRAAELEIEIAFYQSNSEGALIDFLQQQAHQVSGIIINPGALTHYGLALREALADTKLPFVEVHLSNIHAREDWRRRSVVAEIALGQISGLGWHGYIAALNFLTDHVNGVNEL